MYVPLAKTLQSSWLTPNQRRDDEARCAPDLLQALYCRREICSGMCTV